MLLLSLSLVSALHTVPAIDSLSRAWQIKGDVAGNPLNQVCTLQQTGDSLSGSCLGEGGQPTPLSGQVKDGKIITTK